MAAAENVKPADTKVDPLTQWFNDYDNCLNDIPKTQTQKTSESMVKCWKASIETHSKLSPNDTKPKDTKPNAGWTMGGVATPIVKLGVVGLAAGVSYVTIKHAIEIYNKSETQTEVIKAFALGAFGVIAAGCGVYTAYDLTSSATTLMKSPAE